MRLRISIKTLLAFVLWLAVTPIMAQDAIHELDGWRAQREGFQHYRDEQQRQLEFDRRALERARDAADVPSRDKEFREATKEVFKGSDDALKDAFKDAVKGETSFAVARDTYDRAMKVGKQQNAFIAGLQSRADEERLDARIASLKREIALSEKNIALCNQVIAFSDNEIARLESSANLNFHNMTGWFQQVASAFVQAAARQDERRAEDARRAERARQAQARPSGPPNHPTHGDMDGNGRSGSDGGNGGGNGGGGGGGGGNRGGGRVIDLSPGSTIKGGDN